MDELDLIFLDMDVQQMSSLLENEDVTADKELSLRIKNKTLPDFDNKGKARFFTFKRIAALAACFCIAAASSYLGVSYYRDVTEPTTQPTTVQQQAQADTGLLLSAIKSGNESIIRLLISSYSELGTEIVQYTLNYIDSLSYDIVQTITKAVYDSAGTTGLDTLLEGAILGDSEKVLNELKSKQKLLMTPTEKLAFFFSVAFCDSEVVDYFVKMGYDLNSTDSNGNSIYEIALENGNEENCDYAEDKGIID